MIKSFIVFAAAAARCAALARQAASRRRQARILRSILYCLSDFL